MRGAGPVTSVAFIGGFGRSGSTLLELILAQLPQVCALGEVVHLWERGVRRDERCGCGEPFSQCPFWTEIGQRAFGGWRNVDVDAVLSLAATVDRMRFIPLSVLARAGSRRYAMLQEYADYFARVYAAAADLSGAAVVVDSSKHASTAYVLRREAAVQLRVVHIVRDSRGVAYSWTKLMRRPEADDSSDHALMKRFPPWRAALLWNAHNAAFTALRWTGVPVLRVYYERLLARPQDMVTELAEYLGLDVPGTSFISEASVTVGTTHQIAGNPMRFQGRQVTLRRDDAWRERLDPRSRRLVTSLTAPLMVRYGYLGREREDR
jgi:hypothetical protein